MKKLIIIGFLLYGFQLFSQSDTVRIMYYNILNFPGSTQGRYAYFRTTNQYVQADLILVNEILTDAGAIILLQDALNVYGITHYQKASFTNGSDSDNMLFYNNEKFTLYSQYAIETDLRLINEYILYYNSYNLEITNDTIFFYMYSAHLKASTGTSNKLKRLAEVRAFRQRIDNIANAENIFFGGDFNFYTNTEPAYDTLVNYGVYVLNDPLPAGSWHDNSLYSQYHSQSTRTSQFGGGATGGMDDRFDFILFSDDVADGTNAVSYIPNSCIPIGNDGNHFNTALIDAPVNTSVPDSVLQALYYMSDHLPVICDVEIQATTIPQEIFIDLKVFLEGPFSGTEMNTVLNAVNDLPLYQPYNTAPWDYTGTESVAAIPDGNVVDWVLVELRNAIDASSATEATKIAQQVAFLLNDGSIVSLDGNSNLHSEIIGSTIQKLFVVIWHRNHIGIMSANPLTNSEGVYSYDFTTDADQVYGCTLGHKEIGTGIWGMIGGNGDGNRQVNNDDKNNVWLHVAGKKGYLLGDFNMDTQVNNSDKNDVWLTNYNRTSQVPE